MEVVTQEELQAEGILVEEVQDFLGVMELGMVSEATLVAEIQVTLLIMELVEMIAVEITQVVMDTIFLLEVQVFPYGPLWMMDSENQDLSFHLSTQNNFTGEARELSWGLTSKWGMCNH